MRKVFPNSNIRKETIGEVIGFNRVNNSEACEFVSSITGDNSVSYTHLTLPTNREV